MVLKIPGAMLSSVITSFEKGSYSPTTMGNTGLKMRLYPAVNGLKGDNCLEEWSKSSLVLSLYTEFSLKLSESFSSVLTMCRTTKTMIRSIAVFLTEMITTNIIYLAASICM